MLGESYQIGFSEYKLLKFSQSIVMEMLKKLNLLLIFIDKIQFIQSDISFEFGQCIFNAKLTKFELGAAPKFKT